MYGPGKDELVIRPAGIPASAYMAALGLGRVIIAGRTFSQDELDAVQAENKNVECDETPLGECSERD